MNRKEESHSVDSIVQALNAVGAGLTLREAADLYKIPKSTLHSKIKNSSSVDAKKGPPTVLSKTEENDIEKWIVYCANQGFPVTKDVVCDQVKKFITSQGRKTPFKNNRPGHRWFNGFMKRHIHLSKRIAQNVTIKRVAVSESDLRLWFHDVESKLKHKGILLTDPKRIFNLDESSFMLVPKDNSVLAKKGAVVKRIVSNNEKDCLTVLFTASAEGVILPPMIMFDLKNAPKKEILQKIPEGWGVAYSDNGWMTAETFFQFVANIFVPWLKKNNYQFPVVLFVDNHASHVNLPLCKFCVENQVELVALYPNSTHIIQPLDVSFFRPLKEVYRRTLRAWRIDNNVIDFKKPMFAKVLKMALESQEFSKTIQNGFARSGLYPFNANAPNYDVLVKNPKERNSSKRVLENFSETNSDVDGSSNNKLLKLFEEKIIPSSTLDSFKLHTFDQPWSGALSEQSLFNSWRKLTELCGNTGREENVLSSKLLNNIEDNLGSSDNIHLNNNQESDSTNKDFKTTGISSIDHSANVTSMVIDSDDRIQFYEETIYGLQDHDYAECPLIKENTPIADDQIYDQFGTPTLATVVAIIPDSVTNNSILSNPSLENLCSTATNTSYISEGERINYSIIDYDALNNNRKSKMAQNDFNLNKNNFEFCHASSSMNFEDEVIDLSLVKNCDTLITPEREKKIKNCSKNTLAKVNFTSKTEHSSLSNNVNTLNISSHMRDSFTVPKFKISKKANKKSGSLRASVVGDLIKDLEKKEQEKKTIEEEHLSKKQEKERNKIRKEKEQEINKTFHERKKLITQQIKDIKLQINDKSKKIRSKTTNDNKDEIKEEKAKLCTQLENMEKEVLSLEMLALQQKIKIKQERI